MISLWLPLLLSLSSLSSVTWLVPPLPSSPPTAAAPWLPSPPPPPRRKSPLLSSPSCRREVYVGGNKAKIRRCRLDCCPALISTGKTVITDLGFSSLLFSANNSDEKEPRPAYCTTRTAVPPVALLPVAVPPRVRSISLMPPHSLLYNLIEIITFKMCMCIHMHCICVYINI